MRTILAAIALLITFATQASAGCEFESQSYFVTENIDEINFLFDRDRDEDGLCLNISNTKALFCWKVAYTDTLHKRENLPTNYYKSKPLHENFLDLEFYISDTSKNFYEVVPKIGSLPSNLDNTAKPKLENALFYLGSYLSSFNIITAKKEVGSFETLIWLDRKELRLDQIHTSTSGDTSFDSKSHFQCRVEDPRKLLADHEKLVNQWSDYFAIKNDNFKF